MSIKNPDGPKFIEAPHLAHVDLADLDMLNQALDRKNSKMGRPSVNGADPLLNVPRTATRWPGQDGICWYCGRKCVWGGNGITGNLMCSGAREWNCWFSIGFPGQLAVRRICDAIQREVAALSGFDRQFRALIEAAGAGNGAYEQRLTQLSREEESLRRQRQNVQDLMLKLGASTLVLEAVSKVEADEKRIAIARNSLESQRQRKLDFPESVDALQAMFREKLLSLATTSRPFNAVLRGLVPQFHFYGVRLLDGGNLLPRAKVQLALDGIIPDANHVHGLGDLLIRDLTIDLFDPPQRERIREEAMRLAAAGLGQRQIAERIAERPSQMAVYKALALNRMMNQMGLTSPYVFVAEPPANYPKLRRHKNRKYHFEPVAGYQPPAI